MFMRLFCDLGVSWRGGGSESVLSELSGRGSGSRSIFGMVGVYS